MSPWGASLCRCVNSDSKDERFVRCRRESSSGGLTTCLTRASAGPNRVRSARFRERTKPNGPCMQRPKRPGLPTSAALRYIAAISRQQTRLARDGHCTPRTAGNFPRMRATKQSGQAYQWLRDAAPGSTRRSTARQNGKRMIIVVWRQRIAVASSPARPKGQDYERGRRRRVRVVPAALSSSLPPRFRVG